MPDFVSEVSCIEEAMEIDLKNSPKPRKQVAIETYADRTPQQAYEHFNRKINPNLRPNLGFQEGIMIVQRIGQAEACMRYISQEWNYEEGRRKDRNSLTDQLDIVDKEIEDITDVLHKKLQERHTLQEKVKPLKNISRKK
jgi:hypothetical protein